MGERHSGEGPPGRRLAHPGGTLSAPERTGAPGAVLDLETRFAVALRRAEADPEAERSAVTAFRAARDAGAHDARTRARDDWRPGRPRRAPRSLRTTLSLAFASLTLGGVAVAAIGSVGSGTDAARDTTHSARPSAGHRHAPGDAAADGAGAGAPDTASPGRSAHPGHPATARDTLAHCRAFVRAGDRGGALDATAWQRLVTAAGGPGKVTAFCAAHMTRAQGKDTGKADASGKSGEGDSSGENPDSGNGENPGSKHAPAKPKQGAGNAADTGASGGRPTGKGQPPAGE
ncbi:hypothetical protein JK359_05075 [Streptomyces actinomycinicus]|uniref:Uncharacterized protein n=1 Tax=Streptomyces actinomycinicus TaxID=1695166 RepID=A0A937JKH8_9ACTN|nr:hypothetical protein [Streptomyces actinomycinicus]MBL1081355.1 hypothetical protein [Streptomyces actinomycinicus]